MEIPGKYHESTDLSDDISVGLLIGANYTKALKPIEIFQSRNGGPFAFKTRLSLCLAGPVNRTKRNKVLHSCQWNTLLVKQQ